MARCFDRRHVSTCVRKWHILVNDPENADWGAWSKEAVRLMQERNGLWHKRFGLDDGCAFRWDVHTATIRFRRQADEVIASICMVGTTSLREGTFLWGWANESIPLLARKGLALVREFGARHQLALLTTPAFPGAGPEGLELVAIAGRVLGAEGIFIDTHDDITYLFALSDFRLGPLSPAVF